MAKKFISLSGHKTINLDFVISLEYIGSIDASMLGEFVIQNHSDGNAYIKFALETGDIEFWDFSDEKTAQTVYNKIVNDVS